MSPAVNVSDEQSSSIQTGTFNVAPFSINPDSPPCDKPIGSARPLLKTIKAEFLELRLSIRDIPKLDEYLIGTEKLPQLFFTATQGILLSTKLKRALWSQFKAILSERTQDAMQREDDVLIKIEGDTGPRYQMVHLILAFPVILSTVPVTENGMVRYRVLELVHCLHHYKADCRL